MFCNYPLKSHFSKEKVKNLLTFKMSNYVIYCLKIKLLFNRSKIVYNRKSATKKGINTAHET